MLPGLQLELLVELGFIVVALYCTIRLLKLVTGGFLVNWVTFYCGAVAAAADTTLNILLLFA